MVGILDSFWDGLISGATSMLVSGRVGSKKPIDPNITSDPNFILTSWGDPNKLDPHIHLDDPFEVRIDWPALVLHDAASIFSALAGERRGQVGFLERFV